jgi:hypothetical protein
MLVLLTPKEAMQLELTEEEWRSAPRTRAPSLGPRIVIKRPLVKDAADGPIIETVSPTDFIIFFEENRAPVDMNSLQIAAKKWLLTVSLTSRLRPYIQGTSLQANGVEVPAGLFVIQIEIADVAGAKTVGSYRLMAGLLYGSGLRLMECGRLRVKDVDFVHHQIMVRDGKGQKDRLTILVSGPGEDGQEQVLTYALQRR